MKIHIHPLSVLLTTVGLILPPLTQASGPGCEAIFTTSASSINGDWRPAPGDKFMGFRSNSPHFWNWLKTQDAANLFSYKGCVAGDPHILNFGDLPTKSDKIKWGFNDFDDSGVQAPLAGDLIRLLAGSKVSPYYVKEADLLNAYVDGLKQKDIEKSDFIKKMEKLSSDDFNKKQAKMLKKLISNSKFTSDADLENLSSAPSMILNSFNDIYPVLKEHLAGTPILDMGYKIKTTGGSQGLVRFWFLIDKKGEKHILELKKETDPAVSLFSPQPAAEERLNQFTSLYHPSSGVKGPYKILKTDSQAFLLRERFTHLIEFNPAREQTSEETANGKEMTLFIAYNLGRIHGLQNGGKEFLRALEHKPEIKEQIFNLAEDYYQILNSQN